MRIGETFASKTMPLLCKLPLFKRYKPIQGYEVAAKMVEVSSENGQALETFTLDEIFI